MCKRRWLFSFASLLFCLNDVITMSNELKLFNSLSFGDLLCFNIIREGNKKFNSQDMEYLLNILL